MPRFEVELSASHGIKLEVSKREPVEQTVIDPILALFAHMQLRLLTPVFLQRSLLVLCIALSSCQSHKAHSGPSIEFTHIPPAAQGGVARSPSRAAITIPLRPCKEMNHECHAGSPDRI